MCATHNTDHDLHYLTLEEIRQQLEEFTIDQLRSFADRSEVRDYAGAVPNPRTRGVMWPLSAVPLLSHLVTMRIAGKMEPKNVKGFLEDLERAETQQSGLSPISTVLIGQMRRSPDGTPDGSLVRSIGQPGRLPDSLTVLPDDWIEAVNVFKAALGIAADLSREIAEIQRPPRVVDDCVFDAGGAAEFLCCSVRMLRAHVPASFRLGRSSDGDRWYRRDLLELKGGTR